MGLTHLRVGVGIQDYFLQGLLSSLGISQLRLMFGCQLLLLSVTFFL